MSDLKIPFHTAQKLGLVEAPELLLSDKEWKKIKEKSNARQDSSQPCVICKEDFGLQQQVTTFIIHSKYFPVADWLKPRT